jgi:hypothetical protein
MSAFEGKADITATERNFNLRLPQKLRHIRRNPPRLIIEYGINPQNWHL